MNADHGLVEAVSASPSHTMGKANQLAVFLVVGLGVDGDAHAGATVRHRSRVRRDPTQPNLRQVHLMHGELHDELRKDGFAVSPGRLGENITTRGVALLELPVRTRVRLGRHAVVEVTGLRNPCRQLNGIQPGLMDAVLARDRHGNLVRKAGIMTIVVTSGWVAPGDSIEVELPSRPHRRLEPV